MDGLKQRECEGMKKRYVLGSGLLVLAILVAGALIWNAQQNKSTKETTIHQNDVKQIKLTRDELKFQPDFFEVSRSKGMLCLTPVKAQHKKEGEVFYQKQTYKLKKIQLFFPSKKLLKDKKYPGEIRMQHQAKSGDKLTVISYVEIGKENFALNEASQIAAKLKQDDKVKTQDPISTLALINQDYRVVRYKQSEKQLYMVFNQPITLSEKEFDNFKSMK